MFKVIKKQGKARRGVFTCAHGGEVYTLDVAKNDHLAGCTIRDSGLRENYDCMILGLQRNLLPIIGPDVNFVIQRGDLVWLLGSRRMAEKALDDMEEA